MTLESSGQSDATNSAAAPAQADGKALRAQAKSAREATRQADLGARPVAAPVMQRQGAPRGGAEVAAQSPAQRGADGKFAPQARVTTQSDMRGVTENLMTTAKRALRGESLEDDPTETGREALDNVKPKGKSETQKPEDSDAPTPDATEEAPDKPDERATRSKVKDLENARKAMKLEGWTDAELAELSEEATLRHGRRAKDAQIEKARELRLEAEARAKDTGSPKPAATNAKKPDAAKTDEGDDEDGWYAGTAKEAFKDFDGGDSTEPFIGAISKFSRAAVERAIERQAEHIEQAISKRVADAVGGLRFEQAVDSVRADFPEVETDDGLTELAKRVAATARAKKEAGETVNPRALVRAECFAIWGEKRVGVNQAKAAKIRAAKDAGSAIAAITDSDSSKPESMMDLAKRTIREKSAANR